jgi:hypothetical protein
MNRDSDERFLYTCITELGTKLVTDLMIKPRSRGSRSLATKHLSGTRTSSADSAESYFGKIIPEEADGSYGVYIAHLSYLAGLDMVEEPDGGLVPLLEEPPARDAIK